MSTYSIERTEQLVVKDCPTCGVTYAIPSRLSEDRKANGGSWYCPNGHSLHYTETVKDQLAAERARHDQTKAQVEREREWRREEERSHAATRGVVTKLKKRTANGVCPCCHRTFQQLARHMKAKHPEHVAETNQPA